MKISDDKSAQDLSNYIRKTLDQRKVIHLEASNFKNKSIPEERVELSRKSIDINRIREIVQKNPDIREEKVALLKEKITSGTYRVGSEEIADKMIREHLLEDTLKS